MDVELGEPKGFVSSNLTPSAMTRVEYPCNAPSKRAFSAFCASKKLLTCPESVGIGNSNPSPHRMEQALAIRSHGLLRLPILEHGSLETLTHGQCDNRRFGIPRRWGSGYGNGTPAPSTAHPPLTT